MRIDAPATPLGRQWTPADAPAKTPSDANADAAGNVAPALASGVAATNAAGGQNAGAGQYGQFESPPAGQFGGAAAPADHQAPQAASPPSSAGADSPTLGDVRALSRLIDRVLDDLASVSGQAKPSDQGEAQDTDSPVRHVDMRI